MVSKIHFIRHGITEGNKNKWFYGAADLNLTDEGREKLIRFRNDGVYPVIPPHGMFYTTGLVRTEETLKIIYGDVPHRAISKLQEMNFGEYECKSFEELKDDGTFLEWGYDETGDVCLPGAESKNQFNRRISEGLRELEGFHHRESLHLRHQHKDAVSVMICHGGVISAIMNELFPHEEAYSTLWDWMPSPGYGYTVTFADGAPQKWEDITDGAAEGKSFESRM